MNHFNKNISQMFWFFVILFVVMGGWFVWVANDDFTAHAFNARVNMETAGTRGTIYDRNGVALAISHNDNRLYPHGALFAHVVGYSGVSRAGLELSENFTLQRLNRELLQLTGAVIFDNEVIGNSVITTLDAQAQEMLFNGFGQNNGAAVVINVQTGAIVSMVSNPAFNPNTVGADWAGLIADTRSPLLNRASSGLYPPGSTFKLITALAALEYDMDLLDFSMTCTGHHHFAGETLQCWGGNAHGEVDFMRAMAVSCNGFFAILAQMTPHEYMVQAAEQAGLFNQAVPFELPSAIPLFMMQYDAEIDEQIQTSIGQGRTLATPLNMALLTAGIANNGVIMEPHLVGYVTGASGNTVRTTSPSRLTHTMSEEIAYILRQSMVQTVQSGTGTPAAQAHTQIAGKTGTAQNATGIDHSWFVGFAPADEPRYVISIIIENTGGGTRASTLAGQVLGQLVMRNE